ncbi:hypothetical protein PF005_g1540 [Phytophthora fragariae]|uniref:Uncharacterized protein n=1 Tax=Phytophthora fragariae TaxID=53985 RepID=A0A6A3LIE1_9STRA|nr:hypothetical protein PF003_g7705 [Phytophthora fragariae]KAE8942861.1 hypothetical protein PF009_g7408 [Phytophthora fragariae]KAE9015593.1 hypothetical protein PF011_g7553 [Phytophthora fragariae]KAE9114417.1 hypothetical protein PF010_g9721 [Phytophthora fragariae]KAE9121299.1 hypothetical protein PF007_g7866 [Phytophthora fragariae]
MTTETRIIERPAPDALRAVGPTKPHADAPTPSDMEVKPPAPASKKHSGNPEAAKDASASKKPADATEKAKEPPASTKHAKDADEAKKRRSCPLPKSPRSAATKVKAKKTPASPKPTRKTKKVTASSKPAPKKPVMENPAAKQLPKKRGSTKECPKTLKLPPKRNRNVMGSRDEHPISTIHKDTNGPMKTRGVYGRCGKINYFLSIIDDNTSWRWTYVLRSKK